MKFSKILKRTVDPFLGKGKYGWVNPAAKIAHLAVFRPARKYFNSQFNSARSVYASDQDYYGSTGSIVGRF